MELVVIIIGAALTGLAVLAYRHPSGFIHLAKVLSVLTLAIYFGVIVYDLGATRASSAVLRSLELTEAIKARQAIERIQPNFLLVTAGVMGFLAFLWFLVALPLMGFTASEGADGKKRGSGGD